MQRPIQVSVENLPANFRRGRLEVGAPKRADSEVQLGPGGLRIDVKAQSFSVLRVGN
jgi:hypothetical protein